MNLVGGMVTALLGVPVFVAISSNPGSWMAMLGLIVGYLPPYIFLQVYLFCAELFPTSQRALGVGLGWNIGVGLFGGFGGVTAQASLALLGPSGPGWLISCSGLIS